MKTANFTYISPNGKTKIFGTVTLKDDGKVSVSLNNARFGTSAAERYQAKALAQKIVEADFQHEAVTHFHEVKVDKGLVAELTEKTQDLKVKFIEQTKKHARHKFDHAVKRNGWSEEEWYDAYGVQYEWKESPYGHDRGKKYLRPLPSEYHGKKLYRLRDAKDEVRRVVNDGYEKLEAKEVKLAENHYRDSILKLAERLNRKGIVDGSHFEISKAWVGVNLNLTIKHGDSTTKAWTIIAEGVIQRPHYRYLVK
jgi:hypothetical protein